MVTLNDLVDDLKYLNYYLWTIKPETMNNKYTNILNEESFFIWLSDFSELLHLNYINYEKETN